VLVVASGKHRTADRHEEREEPQASQFTAMMRLDHTGNLSGFTKINKPVSAIENNRLGHHSATSTLMSSRRKRKEEGVADDQRQACVEGTLIPTYKSAARRSSRLAASPPRERGRSGDRPCARLVKGTHDGDWVPWDPAAGSYGIPEGVMYGYP